MLLLSSVESVNMLHVIHVISLYMQTERKQIIQAKFGYLFVNW